MSAIETLTARSVCTSPPSPATPLLQPIAPPTPATHAQHNVHWFRRGLRLHDNPSLRDGLVNATTFRCVFLIDPWFASSTNVGINKWRFLLQCLEDLDASLRKLNSRLFVIRGQPADVLPKLFKEWGTTSLTFEEDPEPYGRVRDHNIITKCREAGIKCISRTSHTLFELDKIIERNGGKAPLTYHQFQALIASMPPPRAAEPTISVASLRGATTPVSDDHDRRFGVPTLEELGFETAQLKPPVWIGGESEALARLERHLERKAWVTYIGLPKMTPQSLLASQTGLSPYLRFGCLSAKLFYHQLTELYKRVKKVGPPLSLYGQILWREFFYCAATRNPNFDRMVGNPICVQIPWQNNAEGLAKWENGQTGYPWIDAIMIQLREEGWIHHLARHAVACFLTRGDLWISWEEGMKVFDELLLDADWSVNAGMWMWWSCSSFFQQFFHCYCPVRFGRKTDPNGDFIRKYIPALNNLPTRYIHEPWVAPLSVQEAANCIVGRDYPLPIVDHAKVSDVNIDRINLVYERLAQFYPQGSLNSQSCVMQSSPSPTSIIGSLKQSDYQCSKSPELQATSPYELFPRSMKVNPAYCGERRSIYNQIVMVHKLQNGSISTANLVEPPKAYVANKIHAPIKNNEPCTSSQDYEFQSLAINNGVQAYSPQNVSKVVSTHKLIPSVINQEAVEINYNFKKNKHAVPVYPEKVASEHATTEALYEPEPNSYTREAENENTEDIQIDPQTVNMKNYGTHAGKDEQNNQTNNDK